MKKQEIILDNELDLKQLVRMILDNKIFILIFVIIFTLMSAIYVFYKQPIYEVKSTVELAQINGKEIENSTFLVKKISIIFNIDNSSIGTKTSDAKVTKISTVKGLKNLIEITTRGISNESAIKKNEEVMDFVKKESLFKLDSFKSKVKSKIEEFENRIKYIKTVELENLNQRIKTLKEINIPSIERKLLFNESRLKKYENSILTNESKINAESTLHAIEILGNKSLILNLKKEIEDLKSQKEIILSMTLNELEIKKNIDLKNEVERLKKEIKNQKDLLTKNYVSNSKLVGDMFVKNNPIKPKKKLIVFTSFFASLILSILLVFLFQFIKTIKKEKNDK